MRPPPSKSARCQVSVALFYVRTVKSVRARIRADNMYVSRLKAKSRQHHLTQNIGPVWSTRSRVTRPHNLKLFSAAVAFCRDKISFKKLNGATLCQNSTRTTEKGPSPPPQKKNGRATGLLLRISARNLAPQDNCHYRNDKPTFNGRSAIDMIYRV